MIFVCHFIVCVNLLYSFVQAETFSTSQERRDDQTLLLNSLTAENQEEYLANITSPYWNIPYHEQLKIKQKSCSEVVDMIKIAYKNTLLKTMPCKLLQIVPSPVIKSYRHKDEFSVGRGYDGDPKTVGIKVGKVLRYRGNTFHPTKVVTTKESHKRVAQVFENFIRTSPLPSCLALTDSGHWRRIVVKSNEAGDLMACVVVKSAGYPLKIIEEGQEALKNYFRKYLPNISLYQQQCNYIRGTKKVSPYIPLYGQTYLKETIFGYKFKVLPGSFFPINKYGTEVLCDAIIRTGFLKRSTTVIDICSGTGIFSMMLSKYVRKVYGIEHLKTAIRTASASAKENRINNISFLQGRIEYELKSLLNRLDEYSEIVAIVNSGDTRPGSDVINLIRKSSKISKLVYITGKPNDINSIENVDGLCSLLSSNYPPFRLMKAIPVDLLPQTAHFEVILIFER